MIQTAIALHGTGHVLLPVPLPWVFVVDDDIAVRESVELLLEGTGRQVLGFACAAEFLAFPRMPGPSCVLLDVALPDMSGLAVQERLVRERAAMPVVFLSGRADLPTAVLAMRGGALDMLAKPLAPVAVLDAVDRALECSNTALRREREHATLRRRHVSLTQRESEVFALVVTGLLNKQIGGKLDISEITVKAHRGNMMRKMMARSVPDLVRMAATLGIPC